VDAVCRKGKSLLPIGIVDADGTFEKGGIVSIINRNGKEIARGLTNYGLKEVLLVRGKKTSEIETILGTTTYAEVVHRDNLQLVD
jgi:glutamate 5-kinase